MATKTIIASATFTLVNGTDIAFSDSEAVKAVGQYDHYQNIHATDDNSVEQRFPITAIASVSVTTDTETVDMTDNSCIGGGGCDGEIKLITPQGSFCINASDITSCDEFDGVVPFGFFAGAVLTNGDYYQADGAEAVAVMNDVVAVTDDISLANSDGGVRIYFFFADGESCDEKIEIVVDEFAGNSFVISYTTTPGPGPGPGPK